MIKKILLSLCLCVGVSNAYFMTQNTYEVNEKLLENFDVDYNFFKDSMYSSSKEIASNYQTRYFLKTLREGKDYIPLISSLIEKNHIPKIFLYLAMAESRFSPMAKSNAKAVGIWQLIPETAQKYGLKINEYVDERKDPVKSTKAAIKYMKYLHKNLGKWYLVAMAYNCGQGRMLRAIKEAGTKDLRVLLNAEKGYIPAQTRNYIKKILAIASVTSNPNFLLQKDADYLLNQGSSYAYDPVKVPSATSLASIAKSIGISTEKLKKYNPQFRYYFTPPDGKKHVVYVPSGKKQKFKKNFKSKNNFDGFEVHVVKSGENLSKIGVKYNVRYSLIKKFNNLKSNRLRLKQKLIIPIYKPKPTIYTVKTGDTLVAISHKFKVTTSELKQNNKLNKYLKPGDKIVIPKK